MKKYFAVFLLLLFSKFAYAQNEAVPEIKERDKICLREAFTIGKEYGKKMWEEWEKVPFALLLIEDDFEFLFNHPKPPADFVKKGFDPFLKKDVYYRPKQHSPKTLNVSYLDGTATIFIGTPEGLEKTSAEWVISVLGEHFIQMHMFREDYAESIKSLGISDDENDNTWMLFYKFPYKDEKLNEQFALAAKTLWDALKAEKNKNFKNLHQKYLAEREKFTKMLGEKDYNYFSFKTWRGGVSEFTEYRFATLAAKNHRCTEEYKKLPDFMPFKELSEKLFEELHTELERMSLKAYKRKAFHALGAAEALLLDRVNSKWHRLYFKKKFYMQEYHKRQ
jgi:hypothetical protein